MNKRTRILQRNRLIHQQYVKLLNEGLRTEVIEDRLAERFFISPNTVYRIFNTYNKLGV